MITCKNCYYSFKHSTNYCRCLYYGWLVHKNDNICVKFKRGQE